jgi:Kdo2-lipid IVA lauroyltransferase/acyltransferase
MADLTFRLLARLPLPLLHGLGALLGWLVYLASPTYRRNLRDNLTLAFPKAGKRMLRAAIAHAGRQMLELPYVWLRRHDEVIARITAVSGWKIVEAAQARGEGLFFVTPHLGCFDITAQYIATRIPITVLFRPPKQARLRPVMEAGRTREGMRSAPADLLGVRALMRALKRGEAIGLLPDQVPGQGEGVWSTFFGRSAYTMTLAARLSQIPRTALVFVYAQRLGRGRGFHVHFMAPPVSVEGGLETRVDAINRCIENLIRRCPEQYLWGYNRYKVPSGATPAEAAAQGNAA